MRPGTLAGVFFFARRLASTKKADDLTVIGPKQGI